MQKLVGRLSFAQAAVMARFGRIATEPFYGSIATDPGAFPPGLKLSVKWREDVLPSLAPSEIPRASRLGGRPPIRMYSSATGGGSLASLSFIHGSRFPILLQTRAGRELRESAATTNAIFSASFSRQ